MNQTKLDELIKEITIHYTDGKISGLGGLQGTPQQEYDFLISLADWYRDFIYHQRGISLKSEQEDIIPIPQIGSDNYKEIKSEQEVEIKRDEKGVVAIHKYFG